MESTFQRCITTVMDTTDPDIVFDERGECGYVAEVRRMHATSWHPNETGRRKLDQIVDQIKQDGCNRDFDCIVGLSGGLDSSYLALRMAEHGLRVLAVHVDGGWNSETSVQNIERVCHHNNWDLFTHVVNWDEMRDLQFAYLRAGLVNQDVPQDHAFFSTLWRKAVSMRIKWALSGGNLASESILPIAWRGHDAMDATHIRSVHKKFGSIKLSNYPSVGYFRYNLNYRLLRGMKVLKPLNYMPYVREHAISELVKKSQWRPYGDKHHESIFTKFFQGYYLPLKFGFDKRKAHLSSMILSGQITRDQALIEIEKPPFDEAEIDSQKDYIAKKLRIDRSELERLIDKPSFQNDRLPDGIWMKNLLLKSKATASRLIRLRGQDLG